MKCRKCKEQMRAIHGINIWICDKCHYSQRFKYEGESDVEYYNSFDF